MRIGIDARVLLKPKTGVGRYTRNLISNLLLIDQKNEYILFTDTKLGINFSAGNYKEKVIWLPNFGEESIRKLGSPVWMNSCLPWGLRKEHVDLLFCPNSISPIRQTCKKVLVIHDLSPILFSGLHSRFHSFYLRRTFLSEIKNISKIITVSQSSKKDIIQLFSVPEDMIKVIYSGVGNIFKPINDRGVLNEKLQEYALTAKEFILYVGALNPRKNLIKLVHAYCELRKSSHIEHRLVIVGGKNRFYATIYTVAKNLGLENDVVFTGYIPDDDLPYIYSGADLFVYPSFYEGFGFSPLEAMACGTPVISSNVSSIPEITEDAAILVNPNDVNDIAKAMQEVLTNKDLRKRMVHKALERASFFSWKKTAEKTLKVFEEVYGEESFRCR